MVFFKNRKKNSQLRTVFLALLATFTFVGAAILVFDVEPVLMLQIFLASLLCLVVIIAAAFLFTVLRLLLRYLLHKRNGGA